MVAEKWIKGAHLKEGALHKQLGYPRDHPLPPGLLHEIDERGIGSRVRGRTVTPKLWHRVHFAVNAQKRRH
jgi:hypothetical protein